MANYSIDMLMAEDPTVDIQVNQETINTSFSESPKKIEFDEEDRKSKNGKLITQKSEGKVLSRYLRASTGSCHDACKYGHKHGFNEESKIPLSTIIKKRMAEIREEKKKAAINLEQKRMSLPNLTLNKGVTQSSKELSGNRRYSEIVTPIKTGISRASSTICRPPTVRRKSDVNLQKEKAPPSPTSLSLQKEKAQKAPPLPTSLSLQKEKAPPPPTSLPPFDRNLSNLKKQRDPRKVDSFLPEMKSTSKEITDEEVPEKTLYIIETNPNGKDQNDISIESTPPNEMKPGECGVDTRPIHRQSSSPSSKSKISKGKRIGKTPAPAPAPAPAPSPPPPLSLSISASTKSIKSDIPKAGTFRIRASGNKSESPRKLNIRRGKTVDLQSETTSPLRTRKSMEGGVTSDSSKILKFRRGKITDVPSENTSPIRTRKWKEGGGGGVSLVKKSDSPRKLNFRRGKTVDLPPSEINSPRRLKLKLRRIPSSESRLGKSEEKKPMKSGESSSQQKIAGKVRGRSLNNGGGGGATGVKDDDLSKKMNFRRGKVIDIKPINTTPKRLNFRVAARIAVESPKGKTNGLIKRSGSRRGEGFEKNNNGSNPEKVIILRHREVEEGSSSRRESQSSVNNVIEETANKLVQTRKSKVKALVGAFETIISLHDK